jgi:hypothetical protein
VVAANPFAVDAGVAVLQAGGNAIDAAVAVQAALGLVEPQSSARRRRVPVVLRREDCQVIAFDGRETAPAGATPDMFLGDDGKPLSFFERDQRPVDGRTGRHPRWASHMRTTANCRGKTVRHGRAGGSRGIHGAKAPRPLHERRFPAGQAGRRQGALLCAPTARRCSRAT